VRAARQRHRTTQLGGPCIHHQQTDPFDSFSITMGLINFIKARFGAADETEANAAAPAPAAAATATTSTAPVKTAAPAAPTVPPPSSNGNADDAGMGDDAPSYGGTIFFGSQTGTARRLANKLENSLRTRHGLRFEVVSLKEYEPELLKEEPVALFILSTYEGADGKAWQIFVVLLLY